MPRFPFCTALVVLLVSGPSLGTAQVNSSSGHTRVPATIVLTDDVPAGSRYAVKRIPDAARRDVILLRSDGTGADLSEAVDALLTARLVEGDYPTARRTIRARSIGRAKLFRRTYPWAERVLTDARNSRAIAIAHVGTVRAVQIWLPATGTKRGTGRVSG